MLDFYDFENDNFKRVINKNEIKLKEKIEKTLNYDIIFDYQKFIKLSDEDIKKDDIELIINKCAYKIPGTDGVRALSNKDNQNSSFKSFYKEKKLTPNFIKIYINSFIQLLGNNTSKIVIAEDGRELLKNNNIKSAVIEMLEQLNIEVIDLKIMPTPILVAYSLENKLPAIMITASHNPPEYNGIKLFIGGKKLYPKKNKGEYQLTYNFFKCKDIKFLNNFTTIEKTQVSSSLLKKIFHQVNWENIKKTINNTPLYLDFSNGAYSKIGKKLLSGKSIKTVDLACSLGDKTINENCGVAILEDLPFEVKKSNLESINKLLKDGNEQKKDLYCIVLDGDGDRAFILKYNNKTKSVFIFNGDTLGYIIAKGFNKETKGNFCLTIESDIALETCINKELGWKSKTVGVGDRWLIESIDNSTMFVGCEKSGHVIVQNKKFNPPLLSGNGLLTALLALSFGLSNYEFGFNKKITSYNYPLDSFYRGSKNWEKIENKIINFSKFDFKSYLLSYEYDVLIFKILKEREEIGLIYMRKSGTEPKISISISTKIEFQDTAKELLNLLNEEIN